ncbi:MAG: mismatch-specific DNA-glycosylase [Pseudomonadota bacterium]|nr:mismatch-specific DNA-glycosylase [Pseudomonadota bacterium]
MLPELLAPGLRVVFVGSAAGRVSARRGAYYAGPGNRFWPMLAETGLTPRRFAPEAFRELLALGIGLSDVNPSQSGADAELDPAADEPEALRARLAAAAPRLVAFNGKRPAAAALGIASGRLRFGRQAAPWAGAEIWVLPSTSGLAARWWDPDPWRALAAAALA